MAQQVTNTAAREEADAQRAATAVLVAAQNQAEENTRRVQREERELASAQTRGLNDFKPEYWWRGARAMLEADQQAITWECFRRAFLDKYFPVSARAAKEAQFLRLRQGGMTVAEYAAKLESLAKHFRYFRGQINEGYMCERFIDGLSYELQRAGRGTASGSFYPTGGNAVAPRPLAVSLEGVTCFKCNKKGHYANNCNEMVCWNCNKLGHHSRDCQAPKVEAAVNVAGARRPTAGGRVYSITGTEADEDDGLIRSTCEIAEN
ncbi:uncharacterized protein LOC130719101 [Lotus japonicus]|uniref:uncharacterized protein LOC130719101 n=1 Tax=Lotus japonicus TaxID=34305 RepID=UPI002584598A|nr:uncharacterized protein LOC130719101 [Lotus japonicus]